jgi:hypothetical protein
VTIGVLTHGSSFLDWVRDVVIFEAAWFLLRRKWLFAVTAAVAVRAAFVGHFSVSFYLVALAFTALLVACFRMGSRDRSPGLQTDCKAIGLRKRLRGPLLGDLV